MPVAVVIPIAATAAIALVAPMVLFASVVILSAGFAVVIFPGRVVARALVSMLISVRVFLILVVLTITFLSGGAGTLWQDRGEAQARQKPSRLRSKPGS
jgi:hypothetical protein